MSGKKKPKISESQIIELLWDKTQFEDGCWRFTGFKNRGGYGIIYVNSTTYKVHVLSLTIFKNVELNYSKNGLQALHTRNCPNKDCWNPDHLYAGTNFDNMKDAVAIGTHKEIRKTHCANGHEYNKENTAIRVYPKGNKKRVCIICRNESRRKAMVGYRARMKEKTNA
jgi:hypothetical protein